MIRILVIRFSSIGDIVLTSPVIRCLSEQMPDAEIHYLSKEAFKPVLEPNPRVHKFHYLNNNYPELITKLKSLKFDHIIDLHNNIRTGRIKLALGGKAYSFPKLNFEKWMMVNFKINKLPDIHIVDRYFKALLPIGVVNDGKGLEYFIPDSDKIDLRSLPAPWSGGYVAIVIGAKHETKLFPTSKIMDVVNAYGKPVMLMGGKEDFDRAANIEKAFPEIAFNAAGKYNINQSASLIQQSHCVVSNDTGLMHIAAAFRKKTISIWGNTIPEFGMYPYIAPELSKIMQVENLSCRPCTKIGFDTCPKKHFHCMTMQDEQAIVDAIRTFTA